VDNCFNYSDTSVDYSDTVVYFDSQGSMEDYVKDKHYEDSDYGVGKVAFSIVLNSADLTQVQWDYSIRVNYTTEWQTDDPTVACLYDEEGTCGFTYTIPSTKYSTDDLSKPQYSGYFWGYTYSGFASLQQATDQFIFYQTENDQLRRKAASAAAAGSGQRRLGSASQQAEGGVVNSGIEEISPSSSSSSFEQQQQQVEPLREVAIVNIMASLGLMPTVAFKSDDFQYIISSTLGIFFMLSFLYPVSRIIRSLVLEKETRIKEGITYRGFSS
jgi:hypothetical protein